MNKINEAKLEYGSKIKTGESFRENIQEILEIAGRKGDPVVLMSFAVYIPGNYTLEKFKNKQLDYQKHLFAIELWGTPENVKKGITTNNEIIRKLSEKYGTYYVDQYKMMPKNGLYFNDVCHLSDEGAKLFVDNIIDAVYGVRDLGLGNK